MADKLIRAAGALLWRPSPDGPEIGLVHRTRQQDWTFPKGKLEPGEHVLTAAVRELVEETGHEIALGRPLPTMRYLVEGVPKEVRYWSAEGDRREFAPNPEVDALVWLSPDKARAMLSYPHDAEVLDAFLGGPAETVPLVVLRHAKAVKRAAWSGEDDLRPLDPRGLADAEALAPLLQAFGVQRIYSSDSRRCIDTVAPFASRRSLTVWAEPLLSEPGFAESPDATLGRVAALLGEPSPLVVCTHRPVLPAVVTRLVEGAPVDPPDEPLETGAFFVLHRDRAALARGSAAPVVAVERHRT